MSEGWNEDWVLEHVMGRKWCSYALVANSAGTAAVNRHDSGAPFRGTECITTRCGAWEVKPGQAPDRLPAGRCLRNYRGD